MIIRIFLFNIFAALFFSAGTLTSLRNQNSCIMNAKIFWRSQFQFLFILLPLMHCARHSQINKYWNRQQQPQPQRHYDIMAVPALGTHSHKCVCMYVCICIWVAGKIEGFSYLGLTGRLVASFGPLGGVSAVAAVIGNAVITNNLLDVWVYPVKYIYIHICIYVCMRLYGYFFLAIFTLNHGSHPAALALLYDHLTVCPSVSYFIATAAAAATVADVDVDVDVADAGVSSGQVSLWPRGFGPGLWLWHMLQPLLLLRSRSNGSACIWFVAGNAFWHRFTTFNAVLICFA